MQDILAQRLIECREKKGYTQMQVATYSDITEKAYQNYERERQMPRLNILINIANVYGVSIDYLVGRTDNPDVNK